MSQQEPTIYGDRYEVERLLASGSMGKIYIAHHRLTGQRVALKVLFPNIARHVGGVERFLTEIRAACAIKHQSVIRIFDAGEDNGTFYYAMELLEGQTLGDWLYEAPRPLEQALGLMCQMLGALAEAHDKDIIHRDIKPENIFITQKANGELGVKLLDFGIARELRGARMTLVGFTLGTPTYMSPEQATSPQDICPASDVWSMGVLLYEIVTGKVPFDAETPQAICIQTLCNQHIPASQLTPGLPHDLCTLIDHCLQKEPSARPTNAGELQRLLTDALATLPTGAPAQQDADASKAPPLSDQHEPTQTPVFHSPPRPTPTAELTVPSFTTDEFGAVYGDTDPSSIAQELLDSMVAEVVVHDTQAAWQAEQTRPLTQDSTLIQALHQVHQTDEYEPIRVMASHGPGSAQPLRPVAPLPPMDLLDTQNTGIWDPKTSKRTQNSPSITHKLAPLPPKAAQLTPHSELEALDPQKDNSLQPKEIAVGLALLLLTLLLLLGILLHPATRSNLLKGIDTLSNTSGVAPATAPSVP